MITAGGTRPSVHLPRLLSAVGLTLSEDKCALFGHGVANQRRGIMFLDRVEAATTHVHIEEDIYLALLKAWDATPWNAGFARRALRYYEALDSAQEVQAQAKA